MQLLLDAWRSVLHGEELDDNCGGGGSGGKLQGDNVSTFQSANGMGGSLDDSLGSTAARNGA